jgi:predicted kinase
MELIIFIGLQGSGKSMFYRTFFAATHDYVSKDLLRNNTNPNRRQLQLIESALQAQHSVVVDNTNPSVAVREPLIELGRQYGATIVGYYFEPVLQQSLERNRQRSGKAKVPDVAIYVTAKKLEPPTYAEGFDTLYLVRTGANGHFEISEWIGDTLIPLQSQPSTRPQVSPPGEMPVPHPAKQIDA